MNSEKLLVLKNKVLVWAMKWATSSVDDNIGEMSFDALDVVKILQELGFQIRDADSCDPKEITLLKHGKKGTRIILTCLFSGEKYYLENATEKDIKTNLSSEPILDHPEHPTPKKSPPLDLRCDSVEQLISRNRHKERLNINDDSLNKFYTSVIRVHLNLGSALSRLEKLGSPKLGKAAGSTSFPNINRTQSARLLKSTKPSTPQNPKLSTKTKSSPDLCRTRSSARTQNSKLLSVKGPVMTKAKSNDELKATLPQNKIASTSKLHAGQLKGRYTPRSRKKRSFL